MKKLGIVGAGAIAQAYVQALGQSDFAKLAAVCDVRQEAVDAVAETAQCAGFTSHQAMLDAGDLDGIIVATPPSTHPDIVMSILGRKIPVLCEKPFAVNIPAAEAMLAAGREHGTLVTMASKFRYVEDVIQAKDIVDSGVLGQIQLMENAFVSPVDMSQRWNARAEVSGGGVWIDNGTHSVDIIRYLFGPIEDIQVTTDSFSPDLDVEDNVLMTARTESGVRVRVDLSWSFDKQLPHFIRIFGTNGVLNVGWKGSQYKQSGSSDWTEFGSGYQKIPAFLGNLKDFCAAIDGAKPLITVEDALASTAVVQAGYLSAWGGHEVRVTEAKGHARLKAARA